MIGISTVPFQLSLSLSLSSEALKAHVSLKHKRASSVLNNQAIKICNLQASDRFNLIFLDSVRLRIMIEMKFLKLKINKRQFFEQMISEWSNANDLWTRMSSLWVWNSDSDQRVKGHFEANQMGAHLFWSSQIQPKSKKSD